MTGRGRSASAALVVALCWLVAAVAAGQGKTPARDTTKLVAPRRPSHQPPPPTVVRPSHQPPPPTVVRPSHQPPPPTVVRRPSRQPPPPMVVRPSQQPPPPTVIQPAQQPPPPTVVVPPPAVADSSRPPSLRDILSGALRARAESLLSASRGGETATATPDTAPRPCAGDTGGVARGAVSAGLLEMYSVKYAPAESLLVVSVGLDTAVMRAAPDTLLINLSVHVVDAAGRSNTMNLLNFPVADVKRWFTPRDSSRAGAVLTVRWDGNDRSGVPLGGRVRAGYKVSLVRVRNGARTFVGRGVSGSVPVAF